PPSSGSAGSAPGTRVARRHAATPSRPARSDAASSSRHAIRGGGAAVVSVSAFGRRSVALRVPGTTALWLRRPRARPLGACPDRYRITRSSHLRGGGGDPMRPIRHPRALAATAVFGVACVAALSPAQAAAPGNAYIQKNLVSDQAGMAQVMD